MRALAHHKALALVWCSGLSFAVAPPYQQIISRQTSAPMTAAAPDVSFVMGCHIHGSQLFFFARATEVLVKIAPSQTTEIPTQFTGCHHHGAKMFCIDANGKDIQIDSAEMADARHENDGDGEYATQDERLPSHRHCHFHAGVESLRTFFLQCILPHKVNTIFIVLKQFDTGIIVSTAFVHLYTHASLMFGNKCLDELDYEATTSAIVMAGLFLSFLVEFLGQRIILARIHRSAALAAEQRASALLSTEVVSILVMEAGILFHSLLIGLTLIVAGDSFFITLFVVILFHQVFEGIALGTRIATVGNSASESVLLTPRSSSPFLAEPVKANAPAETTAAADAPMAQLGLAMKKKLGLAALFAFVTPIGMAIGIGVLQKFNGNDKSTLIAIGTLDALSAGILIWIGVVEMWAADWMTGSHGHGAALAHADMLTVVLAGLGLVAGMALMSLLGKWA